MRRYIAAVKAQYRPQSNVYLRALRDGSFGREDFVETQVQFLSAVAFFSRPMAVLAGRLPRPEARLELLHSILEEHGEKGDSGLSHEDTFLTLLYRLGVDPASVDERALWPEVRTFNTALAGLCTLDDTLTALACLGMIEDLFDAIAPAIANAIVDRGFLRRDELVHYTAAEREQRSHAESFYEKLEGPYAVNARYAYMVEQGLDLGAYLLTNLYEGLYRARDRRATRKVRGPHSTATGWEFEPA